MTESGVNGKRKRYSDLPAEGHAGAARHLALAGAEAHAAVKRQRAAPLAQEVAGDDTRRGEADGIGIVIPAPAGPHGEMLAGQQDRLSDATVAMPSVSLLSRRPRRLICDCKFDTSPVLASPSSEKV